MNSLAELVILTNPEKYGSGRFLSMKKFMAYASLALINFIVNFFIYNYSFNSQATPHLHESQRLESGILMLTTTVPAFAVAAILFTVIFYFLSKKLK